MSILALILAIFGCVIALTIIVVLTIALVLRSIMHRLAKIDHGYYMKDEQ